MSEKVEALFAAHRPMSDPVAPDRLVICSCDTETSRDLIAHSRHMIEVGLAGARDEGVR